MNQISFRCENCQQQFEVNAIKPIMTCAKCDGPDSKLHLRLGLTSEYINSEQFKSRSPSVWKYLPNLIPHTDKIISLNEGGTPLRLSNIGTKSDIKKVFDTSTRMQLIQIAFADTCGTYFGSGRSIIRRNIAAETVLGHFVFDRSAHGDSSRTKNKK